MKYLDADENASICTLWSWLAADGKIGVTLLFALTRINDGTILFKGLVIKYIATDRQTITYQRFLVYKLNFSNAI